MSEFIKIVRRTNYDKHSVDRDVKRFCGFDTLLEALSYASNETERRLVIFEFELGGRVVENLGISTEMFILHDDTEPRTIEVRDMMLEKRYRKIGEYRECIKCHAWNPRGSTVFGECAAFFSQNTTEGESFVFTSDFSSIIYFTLKVSIRSCTPHMPIANLTLRAGYFIL